MISFQLDESLRLVQETVRAFAESEVRPAARAAERQGAVSPELAARFQSLGLGAVAVPEPLGGAGLGALGMAVVAEELGSGDPGIGAALLASHPAACLLAELGEEAVRSKWLGALAGRGARLALALSERDPPGDGPGVTAERDGDGWVLQGGKAFVSQGGDADLHLVVARLRGEGDGLGVFAVEAGAPGLVPGDRHDTVGLRAARFAEVALDRCRVPAAARLDAASAAGAGGGAPETSVGMARALAQAAVLPAALAVGCARAAAAYALRYAGERRAFGKPIGHFQAIAFTLCDMEMDVESARWMVWRAARALDRDPADTLPLHQAVAHAHECAGRVTERAVQILGGAGYMQDHPVEKWMRDARTLSLYIATPDLADVLAQAALLGPGPAAALPEEAVPLSGLQPVLS